MLKNQFLFLFITVITQQLINLMEQKSKAQLVQQKIKQMIQTRKRIPSKQAESQFKRMNSNHQAQQISISGTQQIDNKPRSSMIRVRPQTSQRNKNEQTNSITTDSSNKNDIDVKMLINDAFQRGFQLGKYLSKKNLNPEECKNKLLQNSLFYTLIASKLAKAEQEKYEQITEKEIINKLQKINMIQRQEQNCLSIEEKISSLLDKRLKSLSQF